MTDRKHGNRKVQIDGYTFDSAAEGQRYQELKILQTAGQISQLGVHPPFHLVDKLEFASGQRAKTALKYTADFKYFDNELLRAVVEDVKGHQTDAFRIRLHLFLHFWGDKYVLRLTHVHYVRGGCWFEIEDFEVKHA